MILVFHKLQQEVEVMDHADEIRKRIARRKQENQASSTLFKIIYRIVMVGMCFVICFLAYRINSKVQLFQFPESFKQINFFKISEWLPFEQWFVPKDHQVNAIPKYALLEKNFYSNGSNQAYTIGDGIVIHIENGLKSKIVVKQDNGTIITYGNLNEVHVKEQERVKEGNILGVFHEKLSLLMMRNGQEVDLETASQK